jgi:hypothetical protein
MQTQTVYGVPRIKFCDAISKPGSFNPASSLDFVAHNVFSTRLARVADRVDLISKETGGRIR